MKTNLMKWTVILLISVRMMAGAAFGQAGFEKGGYRPDPFFQTQGFTNEQFTSQSSGFENHFAAPNGYGSNWGQSQSTQHTLQYGQMAAAPWGYSPTFSGGYVNEGHTVQTAGFQNTQFTPCGTTTSWGQSQLTGHTLEAGQYGPYGSSQWQVSGHSLQYATSQAVW